MPLIQCGDDGFAPAVILCVHLANGISNEWCAVPSGDPEVDYDWLCPDCFKQKDTISVDDIRAVCMHCATRLRQNAQHCGEKLDSMQRCYLYCTGKLQELERLGLVQGDGADRLSQAGVEVYQQLIANGYTPDDAMMLECLTQLFSSEDTAENVARLIEKHNRH